MVDAHPPLSYSRNLLVRWLSGRKQRFAKAPYPKRVPRVRIPPSPDSVCSSRYLHRPGQTYRNFSGGDGVSSGSVGATSVFSVFLRFFDGRLDSRSMTFLKLLSSSTTIRRLTLLPVCNGRRITSLSLCDLEAQPAAATAKQTTMNRAQKR